MNAFCKSNSKKFNNARWRGLMRSRILASFICALLCLALTACGGNPAGEAAFTAAQGPADSALPYQAVFAIDRNADRRLRAAAQEFCDKTAELSRSGTVFSLIESENALQDLKAGKADMVLLENAGIDAFSPVAEAFRYKSYEHFAMTANADTTLQVLSDILDANVYAGFYAGSDIFLSHGTLDSKFRPLLRKDAEDARDMQTISVAARSDPTAQAFTLLEANASVVNELDARIRACSSPNAVAEFSYAELNSPAVLAALREAAVEAASVVKSNANNENSKDTGSIEPAPATPEPFMITPAYTGIRPVWLVFAPDVYEKLSQTNRAAVDEAVAYMVSDIDGVYLAYEHEIRTLLAEDDITTSNDFTATRALALRLADENAAGFTESESKLRAAIARIQ